MKSLNCPSCGAALTVRSFSHAVTIVCDSCHSILDAQDPKLKILQKFQVATDEDPPLIPLGTRGKIRGTDYEVIGFQRRTIHVDGIAYSWHEYVLFNPFKGFRYLTEYDGHWNDVSMLKALPICSPGASTLNYLGETYKHFQTARAGTTFVLGEFPWQVRVGESAKLPTTFPRREFSPANRQAKKSPGRWASTCPATTSGRRFKLPEIRPMPSASTKTSRPH